MDLEAIATFVKVVQAGSFVQAARTIGMPNSTASTHVSRLEKNLGVTLIQRTTRKMHVTEAGMKYFNQCVLALSEMQAACDEVKTQSKVPHGKLRITAPVDMGHWILPAIVKRYNERHPQVSIELMVTNRNLDLLTEGIDLALRAGIISDTSVVVRPMDFGEGGLWASPGYLRKNKAPMEPEQLKEHKFISFHHSDGKVLFTKGRNKVQINLEGTISTDDPETIKMLVLQDLGIGPAAAFLCDHDAKRGALVRILPEWKIITPAKFAFTYPVQRFVPAKVSAFLEIADEMFGASVDEQ